MDDRVATEEALSSNFLIPPDENVYNGKTLAQLCCDSLKDFNPMVRVSVEEGFSFHDIPLIVYSTLLSVIYILTISIM